MLSSIEVGEEKEKDYDHQKKSGKSVCVGGEVHSVPLSLMLTPDRCDFGKANKTLFLDRNFSEN